MAVVPLWVDMPPRDHHHPLDISGSVVTSCLAHHPPTHTDDLRFGTKRARVGVWKEARWQCYQMLASLSKRGPLAMRRLSENFTSGHWLILTLGSPMAT